MTDPLPGQVRLDIFADPVCPWCMIGKAELDQALERRPGHPFAITWQPFASTRRCRRRAWITSPT